MNITICMSMLLSDRLPALTRELEAAGHVVFTPVDTEGFDYVGASTVERAEQKRSYNLIRKHWQKIQRSDAILVVNEDLPGPPGAHRRQHVPRDGLRPRPGAPHLHDAARTRHDLREARCWRWTRSSCTATSPASGRASGRPSRRWGTERMRILIVGGGGREHALAWAISRSPSLRRAALRARQRGHGGARRKPADPRLQHRRARPCGAGSTGRSGRRRSGGAAGSGTG